jgi:hypothetical protein
MNKFFAAAAVIAGVMVAGSSAQAGKCNIASMKYICQQIEHQKFLAKRECYRKANRNVPQMQDIQANSKGIYDIPSQAAFLKLKNKRDREIQKCDAMPEGSATSGS